MSEQDERRRTSGVRGTLEDELRHHFESRVAELRERGWSREDAEREARRRLGDLNVVRHQVRRQSRAADRRARLARWIEELWQDSRIGTRRLLRSPVFSAIAVLTLALGIGANTALFGVVHTVILQPLPYPEPDRLVRVWESEPSRGWDLFAMSGPNFVSYRSAVADRIDLAAVGLGSFTYFGEDLPLKLDAYRVSANFVDVLGITPLHGRDFLAEEDEPRAPARVAMLGHELWQRRFGGDPAIVGRHLRLDDGEYLVVGILPSLEPLVYDDALFVPLAADPNGNRSHHELMAFARTLAPIGPERVETELDSVAARLAVAYPESNEGYDTRVMSLYGALIPEEMRTALWVLLGAVGLVLLIACANLSNMMLARATDRQRELAVYGALGAERGRIARQLITESLLLSVVGAAVGIALALRAVDLARGLRIEGIPRLDQVAIDGPVLAFAVGIALATGLASGLLPALRATDHRLPELLADGGRGEVGSRRSNRLRTVLMTVEVALAVVLLAGAGLLLRSFLSLQAQDSGLDVERVLTMELSAPLSSEEELQPRVAMFRELVERLGGVPGIDRASAVSALPFGGGATVMTFEVEGAPPTEGGVPSAGWRLVTPDYFATVGIELLAGREFTDGDDLEGPHVAIISERMAERHWSDRDPIGQRFFGWQDRDRPLTVVGVVEDVRERSLETEADNLVYLPYYRNPWWADMFLVVRGPGDLAARTPEIRAAVADVSPDLAIAFVRPLSTVLAQSLAPRRFSAGLLAAFAALALVLAAAGVYGVVSYVVARRRPEIGLRMAMGARGPQVVRLVVRQSMRAVAAGAAIGVVGAFLGGGLLASQLYGVHARDPLTLLAAVAFLGVVGLVACGLPALQAARVDPMETLRDG